MTSRMEFRNYRSSAQLVHCNIHEKRYSDVPGKLGHMLHDLNLARDFKITGTGVNAGLSDIMNIFHFS